MGEGFIVRRGGGGQQTVKPIYNSLTEVSFTSLTLSVTNDSNSIATLYYSVVNTEPAPDEAGTFDTEFQGKETKDITITGLTAGTTYTVYIKAIAIGEFPSETVIVPNLTTTNSMTATGGTITEINITNSPTKRYRLHTFTGNGTFAVTQLSNTASLNQIDYLIVGGGGGGGATIGGGGGSGGLVFFQNQSIAIESLGVTIGGGGLGGSSYNSSNQAGLNGANSTFRGKTARGGGGGDGWSGWVGAQGGSSGGRSANESTAQKAALQPGTNPGATIDAGGAGGGRGRQSGNRQAGGGGGAGGPGETPSTAITRSGNGGLGLNMSSYFGTLVGDGGWFASGGGGSGDAGGNPGGTASQGGGTNGQNGNTASSYTAMAAAPANRGGGGGALNYNGQSFTSNTRLASAGGSGIVIIRYEIAPTV
jgi:hypothetical protein